MPCRVLIVENSWVKFTYYVQKFIELYKERKIVSKKNFIVFRRKVANKSISQVCNEIKISENKKKH